MPVMEGREAVDKDELDDNAEDVLEEEALELEPVWVIELRTLVTLKGALVEEDDCCCCEVEAVGVLEVAGVFLDGAGVLDGVGVEFAVVLDADGVPVSVPVAVGGSAAAPLAAPALPLSPSKSPPTPPCGEGARFLIRRLRLT